MLSPAKRQMSVPPAVCGALGLYLFAFSSDRREERGYHITAAMLIVLAGLVAVVTASTNAAKYAALCVLLFGSYVPPPLTVAWLSGNTPAPGKRALVLGVNGWGNLAGVIGSQLYRPEHAPSTDCHFLRLSVLSGWHWQDSWRTGPRFRRSTDAGRPS
jgi:MFS family permease